MKFQKYILEITVFLCGAIVMIFELVGSRVLGPYFGTSIFVWTSLIGIILGSLSLGYHFGGKYADNNSSFGKLSLLVFLASFFMGVTIIVKEPLLQLCSTSIDSNLGLFIGSILLFSPVSIFLGMVSPYAVKLKLENLENSGKTIGNLYALSTVGSIVGTFISGFYLIPLFGTNNLLIILAILLVLLSIIIASKQLLNIKLPVLIILFLILIFAGDLKYASAGKDNFLDIDTSYNRIWIYDHIDPRTKKVAKVMGINNENHSSMFLNSDELVNEYVNYYHLVKHFNPNFKKTLMFGGAGYSYPKDFLLKYPDATMDVVEIDPKVTELAKKYFNLKENPRLNIYHEDGRIYLNKTQNKYDVIFGDAFSSHYSIPYQLTTKEAVQKKYDILNNDGIVILNIISSVEGEKGKFTRAEYATYKSIFPQVYLFTVNRPNVGDGVQNLILVALKSKIVPSFNSPDPKLDKYLQNLWKKEIPIDMPIITDDYAPVDYYINKTI